MKSDSICTNNFWKLEMKHVVCYFQTVLLFTQRENLIRLYTCLLNARVSPTKHQEKSN